MGPDPYKDGNPPARDLLYKDVAKYYKWVPKNKDTGINAHWKRRKTKLNTTVGRVRHVDPSMECKELFHLRLLLNVKKAFYGQAVFTNVWGHLPLLKYKKQEIH